MWKAIRSTHKDVTNQTWLSYDNNVDSALEQPTPSLQFCGATEGNISGGNLSSRDKKVDPSDLQ